MIPNSELADIFSQFGEILEIKNEDRFRIIAYERAAQAIKSHGESLELIYKKDGVKGLEKINGIGESIASKIEEFIKTGQVRELESLKKSYPKTELDLLKVPGIGPKTATKIYRKLKVKRVTDLKSKLEKEGQKIFKPKTLQNILRGIEIQKNMGGRMLLSEAWPIAQSIVKYVEKSGKARKTVEVGSLRRFKETVGDIDIVASSGDPQVVIEHFSKCPDFKEILSKGATKCSAVHRLGMQVDLEILPEDSFGSLLQHFTGSKEHNIALRGYAQTKSLSVSEHGIKNEKTRKIIKCETEEKVYSTLGMDYIEPELREDRGEIEAAIKGKLPELIRLDEVRGDLHMHSNWSDGESSIIDLAEKAQELGYDYIAIADHTVGLGIASGLDLKRFLKRKKEIDAAQKRFPKIKIFNSCEVNINSDGELDLPDDIMKTFDVVTASIHTGFNQPKEKITARLLKAISNKFVDIIGHPSGRILNRRESYLVDWREVFKACVRENVALEINAYPDRLDLGDALVFEARKLGVKFVISTDSHSKEQLNNMLYGVSVARRGWCEKGDIVNTKSAADIICWLKSN